MSTKLVRQRVACRNLCSDILSLFPSPPHSHLTSAGTSFCSPSRRDSDVYDLLRDILCQKSLLCVFDTPGTNEIARLSLFVLKSKAFRISKDTVEFFHVGKDADRWTKLLVAFPHPYFYEKLSTSKRVVVRTWMPLSSFAAMVLYSIGIYDIDAMQ